MTRREDLLAPLFGVVAGVTASSLLPGHRVASLPATALLSLAGGLAGNWAAEAALPTELSVHGSYLLAGLGAVAMLLLHSVFSS